MQSGYKYLIGLAFLVGVVLVGLFFIDAYKKNVAPTPATSVATGTVAVATPVSSTAPIDFPVGVDQLVPISSTPDFRLVVRRRITQDELDGKNEVIRTNYNNVTNLSGKKPPTDYATAVTWYGGYRFQFSNNCRNVTPNRLSIKVGNLFMLDNRENVTHTFYYEGQEITLNGWGFSPAVPKTAGIHYVMCDGARVAEVNVVE